MGRFKITEARARFCYFPGITHTVMSERRAAELMAAKAWQEGQRPMLPHMQGGAVDTRCLVREDVVLPMLDSGLGVEDVAVRLGVSPETIRDRLRMWRPVRRPRRPGVISINDVLVGVAAERGVSTADILGAARGSVEVSRARQEAMMRAADAGHHEVEIARVFKRDRTTVIHGIAAARQRAVRA